MKVSDGPEERFHFTQSGKYVVRSVRIPKGKTVSSRIRFNGRNLKDLSPSSAFDYAFLRLRQRMARQLHAKSVRVLDVFSGCGGLSLGVYEACNAMGVKFIPIAALDSDRAALSVYKGNFDEVQAYQQDIWTLVDGKIGTRPTKTEYHFLDGIQPIDFLLAGPPCQGHSDLNNFTRRKDPRNILYERVARLVELARPLHIIVENVPPAVHGKYGALKRSIEVIDSLGYQLHSDIVNLVNIGVPQKRKRHILVASRVEVPSLAEIEDKYEVESLRSVRWAIDDLEDEPPNGIFARPSRHAEENMRRIDYLHDNDVYDLPDQLRPPCHRNGRHSYKSMYGRIRYDEPSQTITSGFVSPGQGRFVHPRLRRTITPHEAARLQFFPDYFDFSNTQTRRSLADMIGNAVPMKLSYVISLELLAAS